MKKPSKNFETPKTKFFETDLNLFFFLNSTHLEISKFLSFFGFCSVSSKRRSLFEVSVLMKYFDVSKNSLTTTIRIYFQTIQNINCFPASFTSTFGLFKRQPCDKFEHQIKVHFKIQASMVLACPIKHYQVGMQVRNLSISVIGKSNQDK